MNEIIHGYVVPVILGKFRINANTYSALAKFFHFEFLDWHSFWFFAIYKSLDEGRIGTVDALSPRPNPVIFDFKHRSTVYNLTYGPTAINVDVENGDENIDSISLYSLGDGVVFMHKAQR